MSLKFGIYLVEQRIITPEQFCGLVKVQQEATMSIANIAIRKNVLTIKQVADIFDMQESNPEKSFLQIGIENDLMDDADANMLVRVQELTSPSIQKLTIECGLLTERQASVLYHHFEKMSQKNSVRGQSSSVQEQTAEPKKRTAVQPSTPSPAVPHRQPPAPKYQQKPVIVSPYQNS